MTPPTEKRELPNLWADNDMIDYADWVQCHTRTGNEDYSILYIPAERIRELMEQTRNSLDKYTSLRVLNRLMSELGKLISTEKEST